MKCAFCGKEIVRKGPIVRNDQCPHCARDLRCCKQCKFFDPNAFNECREISAERINDKERANFCDRFLVRGSKRIGGRSARAQDAMAALEALFKKKD